MKKKIINLIITLGFLVIIFQPIKSHARSDELIFEANTYNIGRTGSTTNIIYNKYGYTYLPYQDTVIRRLYRGTTNSVNIRVSVHDLNTGTKIHDQTSNNSISDGWFYQPGSNNFGKDVNIKFYYVTYDISEPDEPPTQDKDYTNILNQILSRLNLNSETITNININITNISNKIDITNERLTTINNSINTARSEINNRLDIINNSINSIKNELTTNKGIQRNERPDWSNNLKDNKPTQPQNKFTDSNQYFSETGNETVNATLPQASEPIKWDDVEDPEEMKTDSELNKDTELNKDEEIKADTELSKEEFNISDELSKEEFNKDSELNKDKELNTDNELEKDIYYIDDEFQRDQYELTEEFEQNHEYEQNHNYEQEKEDYNLRWKSTNGKFH